jgi:hypothetical protein
MHVNELRMLSGSEYMYPYLNIESLSTRSHHQNSEKETPSKNCECKRAIRTSIVFEMDIHNVLMAIFGCWEIMRLKLGNFRIQDGRIISYPISIWNCVYCKIILKFVK